MNFIDVKGTPFDYGDDKIDVYFEVADKNSTKKILENLDFINNIKEMDYGFQLNITIQQIPEVIRYLSEENVAIYSVIQK